jgi:hypothetical protein
VLPFGVDEFLAAFARYNAAVWPVQWLLYGLALAVLLLATSRWPFRHRAIGLVLALLWAWMALAYHLFAFARINSAAYGFAGAFLVEAGLLAWVACRREPLEYSVRFDARGYAALAMIVYALAVYPGLNRLLGHLYPAAPTFGVPCPTTIFTLGLLMLARGRGRALVLVVPLAWAAVGGTAAFLLDMPEDLGLVAAGLVALTGAVVRRGRAGAP